MFDRIRLGDPFETDAGLPARNFSHRRYGDGSVRVVPHDGLGNLVVEFLEVQPLPSESSVVMGVRLERDPSVVIHNKATKKLIKLASRSVGS